MDPASACQTKNWKVRLNGLQQKQEEAAFRCPQGPKNFCVRRTNYANRIMPADHSARADESSAACCKPGLGARALIGEAERLGSRSKGLHSQKQGIVAAVYLGREYRDQSQRGRQGAEAKRLPLW